MKLVKRLALLLVPLLSVGSLFFSVWHLLEIEDEYKKGEDTYRKMEETFIKEPATDTKGAQNEEPETYPGIDFERLKELNPDIIGWIEIPGAGISYPLVQGDDNSYYLTHMSSGEYGIHGSIFMDYHNSPDFSDSNTIVYGHNMKDGTMFASLSSYQDPEVYGRYPYFYIYLPNVVLEYQIFSCYSGQIASVGYTYLFPQTGSYQEFLNTIQSYAGYETGIRADTTDRIVTLSTCVNTDHNHRYLIHGKEIRKIKEENHD